MKPERWQRISTLFLAALERGHSGQGAFLDEACAGDSSLRQEVESLLASHGQVGDFIEAPAVEIAAPLLVDDQAGSVVGQMIGRYRILAPLGEGGMGEVYLAQDTRLGRKIAIKLLPAYLTQDNDRLRRFEQEAHSASTLSHPNVCVIHEIGETEDGRHFIAMEYVDGLTLRERMTASPSRSGHDGSSSTGRRMKLGEVLDIATQITSALVAAHAAGIVHRDIKPENIMLRRDGYLKVLDFGLAKLTLPEPAAVNTETRTKSLVKTHPGMVMGTAQYMSPEQASGLVVDVRSDIWSLGVVLYEMLTGLTPFAGKTPSHVLVSILEKEPPPLAQYAQEAPAELQRIISKALRKNREERYQTAKDLDLDLKSLKKELELGRLDRSIGPHIANQEAATNGSGQAARGSAKESAAHTLDAGATDPPSSAEYIVGQIASHRRSVVLALAALVIGLAAVVYYFYFAKGVETIDSVAVLPFVNASNDPNTEYLSEGISDTIIDSLSQLPNLKKVIPLSSVLRFKGKQIDPQAVGHELNVRAVLTGRLTQRGDDLLISTELVDVTDNKRLWGGQYNRKLADIVNLQTEIAREISEKLRLKLTGGQKERLTKAHTENAEAYELYLQGRYYGRKGTDEARIKASEYFQKAIEKDPNYALGYAGLAYSYGAMANFGQLPPKEAWRKAEEAAVKALAIDDTLSEAHVSLGSVKVWYDWDWPGAEREYKRAIELNPELFEAHVLYGSLLRATGRFGEAIAEAKRANEADPSRPDTLLGIILYQAGRYDEAIAVFQKAIDSGVDRGAAHLHLGEIYLKQARNEDALAEMLKAKPLVNRPRQVARIGYVYAAAGKKDEAIKIRDEMKGLTSERYDLGSYIASIYAALGNKEQAFAWLENALDDRENAVVDLKVDPRFDALRSDPRFTALLRRVRLAP